MKANEKSKKDPALKRDIIITVIILSVLLAGFLLFKAKPVIARGDEQTRAYTVCEHYFKTHDSIDDFKIYDARFMDNNYLSVSFAFHSSTKRTEDFWYCGNEETDENGLIDAGNFYIKYWRIGNLYLTGWMATGPYA